MDTYAKLCEAAERDPFLRCFIIDAVLKQARAVAASSGKKWPKDCIISFELWKRTAKQIIDCETV